MLEFFKSVAKARAIIPRFEFLSYITVNDGWLRNKFCNDCFDWRFVRKVSNELIFMQLLRLLTKRKNSD
jgi:hypothetical protein